MPHSKGWRRRKDERTLHETRIGDIVDGLLREKAFARGMPIGAHAGRARWSAPAGCRVRAGERTRHLGGRDHRPLGRPGASWQQIREGQRAWGRGGPGHVRPSRKG
jgi:hypothetical protein